MRISDWSSDVCSSDLRHAKNRPRDRPKLKCPRSYLAETFDNCSRSTSAIFQEISAIVSSPARLGSRRCEVDLQLLQEGRRIPMMARLIVTAIVLAASSFGTAFA